MEKRKIIPIINSILFAIFAYYLLCRIYPMFEGTPAQRGVFLVLLISIISLGIAVIISILLYWFNVGVREEV
ncbi:MAG: hypothetical protein DRJ51_05620 [Thermoprotei archaeon]|nr:MAG: hypothetical protein DRJ51_05620 [Thermoprotei archaeon]